MMTIEAAVVELLRRPGCAAPSCAYLAAVGNKCFLHAAEDAHNAVKAVERKNHDLLMEAMIENSEATMPTKRDSHMEVD